MAQEERTNHRHQTKTIQGRVHSKDQSSVVQRDEQRENGTRKHYQARARKRMLLFGRTPHGVAGLPAVPTARGNTGGTLGLTSARPQPILPTQPPPTSAALIAPRASPSLLPLTSTIQSSTTFFQLRKPYELMISYLAGPLEAPMFENYERTRLEALLMHSILVYQISIIPSI
jgi:hypothetical protein